MAVTHVSLYRVRMDGDAPRFRFRDELPVTGGAHADRVRQFIQSGQNPTPYPHHNPARPERSLDVIERKVTGTSVYVFEVEMRGVGNDSVRFPTTGSRFIKFPVNFPNSDDFLTEIVSYDENNGRWAAFSCDIDRLRNSDLANQIRQNGGLHNRILRIPFYFSLVDPALGAAPWVLADHSGHFFQAGPEDQPDHPDHPDHPEHPDPERDDRKPARDTHGGVHPSPLAFYSVSL